MIYYLEELENCVKEDLQKGILPDAILVNLCTLFLLMEEGSVTEIEEHDPPYKGEVNYKTYIFSPSLNQVIMIFTLPDFHPQVQKIFKNFEMPVVEKDDNEKERDSKGCAVWSTVTFCRN